MLEVKIPGHRNGDLYRAGTALKQGAVGYISAINTNGYFLLSQPTVCTMAALSVYPYEKYYYAEDLSDSAAAVNTINAGERLIVFERGGEYITDLFVHTGLTHTAWSECNWDTALTLTDTASYSLGSGLVVWLYPSITADKYGWLTAASTECVGNAAGTSPRSALNRNFILTRAWSGMYTPFTKISFKVLENSPAFNGQYIATADATGRDYHYSPYYLGPLI
jgi:hypothetical protein